MTEILPAARHAARPSPSAPPCGRLAAAIGVAALLYGAAGCSNPPNDLKHLAKGGMVKLWPNGRGVPPPPTVFADAAGRPHTLAEFKGKVAIVNIWANWCAPCKTEIPSLARLAAAYAGKPVAVVAISVGKAEDETAGKAFIARNPPLIFYSEPTYALAYAFRPPVEEMPTTILYDRRGVERARLAGGADWSGPDAGQPIDHLIAEK